MRPLPVLALLLASVATAGAQDNDTAALARAAQNPVAAMISVPIQNNLNMDYGPRGHAQNILNIQPVVPVRLNEQWNVITRTVIPLVSQPGLMPGDGTSFGIGAAQISAFISPSQVQNGFIWGAGAVVQAPTITDTALGSNIWGAGPGVVALTMQGPWVIGGLANNVWSLGGGPQNRYSNFTVQPFVNYNVPQSPGTYLSFSPVITANWEARSGQQWTVPVGFSVGQIFRIGEQPVNAQIGAYHNVIRPDLGPDWQIRFQLSLMFPR